MNEWGLPRDAPAWAALTLGLLCLLAASDEQRFRNALLRPSRRWFLSLACAAAFALSLGYVGFYLRGGPRIVDATSYYLQARTLASGALSFEAPGPLASFHTRFTYATAAGDLASIFPPGYPLILAPFALFGVPLLLGPVLGAALVAATYALCLRHFDDEVQARVAAVSSVLCAALRYHTADTMSHGWSALLLCLGLLLAGAQRPALSLVAGLALGWLFATRPLSGLVGMAGFALLSGWAPRRWALAALTFGSVVLLFFAHQAALTGEWGGLVQRAYYATADGPPGCFDLGFRRDIGCVVEHGDFIARFMPDGFGVSEGLAATGRRLWLHSTDAGNSELLFALLMAALFTGRTHRVAWRLGAVVVAQVAAYVVFYFDGNYPGGGARMYADVLPLEHALIAWVLVRWRLTRWVVPALLLGFALHTSFDHHHLSERDGGRPMYEPERVPPEIRLVYVDTDHGFGIGHAPNAPNDVVVAMHRGDALDWELWQQLGRPPAARYLFDMTGRGPPVVVPYTPMPSSVTQAESLWPLLAVHGGWVEPVHGSGPCFRGGRQLRAHAAIPGELVALTVPLWAPAVGPISLVVSGDSVVSVVGGTIPTPLPGPCPRWAFALDRDKPGPLRVELRVLDGSIVDEIQLVQPPTPAP